MNDFAPSPELEAEFKAACEAFSATYLGASRLATRDGQPVYYVTYRVAYTTAFQPEGKFTTAVTSAKGLHDYIMEMLAEDAENMFDGNRGYLRMRPGESQSAFLRRMGLEHPDDE